MKELSLLGLEVQDKVTKFIGIVTSISYDLYGCIQAIVSPPVDKDGKDQDGRWYDVSRLKILNEVPVMEIPKFPGILTSVIENDPVIDRPFSSYLKGPAKKPIKKSQPI